MRILNEEYRCPLTMFCFWESNTPSKVFLNQRSSQAWRSYTWKEAGDEIRKIVSYIDSLGLVAGSHIGILSKNSAHWVMADLAIWLSGHVSVPLYPNLSATTLKSIVDHSDIKVCFIGNIERAEEQVNAIANSIVKISLPGTSLSLEKSWEQILKEFPASNKNRVCGNDEIASIIYTSGTTGEPKGVVHSFQAFTYAGFQGSKTLEVTSSDRFFSYLPLAHVAERLLVETFTLYSGAQIFFAGGLDTFADDLKSAQPSIFLAVPRVWTKFQQKIQIKFSEKKLNTLLKIPLVSVIIKNKIQSALGLNKARILLTGAAPTSITLLNFFSKLGMQLQEAYGMTENYTYSHYTRPKCIKFTYVGQPFPGVETKITEGGEVIMKSPALLKTFYKNHKLYEQVVQNGYLLSGDCGEIDSESSLKITGRIKDTFKTEKGKYVVPSPIELRLQKSSLIEMVCVMGVELPQPIALITLSEMAKTLHVESLKKDLNTLRLEINAQLDPHEKLDKIIALNSSWSPESGELTPTMKIKRQVLESRYKEQLVSWAQTNEYVLIK